uniref:Uncharacterized protein n=1 Tax=Mycena chlorophos TaxID=658473 RepID=A0ABQ0KXZ5_MYCCL|nr:predicted protein [Mycena chlorophos]
MPPYTPSNEWPTRKMTRKEHALLKAPSGSRHRPNLAGYRRSGMNQQRDEHSPLREDCSPTSSILLSERSTPTPTRWKNYPLHGLNAERLVIIHCGDANKRFWSQYTVKPTKLPPTRTATNDDRNHRIPIMSKNPFPASLPRTASPRLRGTEQRGKGKTPLYYLAWRIGPHDIIPGRSGYDYHGFHHDFVDNWNAIDKPVSREL